MIYGLWPLCIFQLFLHMNLHEVIQYASSVVGPKAVYFWKVLFAVLEMTETSYMKTMLVRPVYSVKIFQTI